VLAAAVLVTALIMSPTQAHTEPLGWQASAYTGKWYAQKWEPVRKCISQRESRHNYRAKNRTSSASGAYQFLDSRWRVSLTHMMMREARSKSERQDIKALRTQPIHKWSRYWQDRAFYTAWRHGKGAQHWAPTVEGTSKCI
jgi:hypothetical protein